MTAGGHSVAEKVEKTCYLTKMAINNFISGNEKK